MPSGARRVPTSRRRTGGLPGRIPGRAGHDVGRSSRSEDADRRPGRWSAAGGSVPPGPETTRSSRCTASSEFAAPAATRACGHQPAGSPAPTSVRGAPARAARSTGSRCASGSASRTAATDGRRCTGAGTPPEQAPGPPPVRRRARRRVELRARRSGEAAPGTVVAPARPPSGRRTGSATTGADRGSAPGTTTLISSCASCSRPVRRRGCA